MLLVAYAPALAWPAINAETLAIAASMRDPRCIDVLLTYFGVTLVPLYVIAEDAIVLRKHK